MAENSVKIEGLLGMIIVKLQEDNFVKWSYQFSSVLRGYDLFEFFNGESQCPPKYCITSEGGVTKEISTAYKQWIQKDLALLSLLVATLSDEVMDYVIGCKTAQEAWENLQERFASVSVVRVNQLKTEFHTAQKGNDSVDKFLLRLKVIKDQLISAGERITENDLMIAVLLGLPPEFEVIKTVILARDTSISLKDFRAQLIGVEASFETKMNTLAGTMSAMYMNGESSNARGTQSSFQNFEQGESSASQRYQGGFNGGSGFAGNGGRSFQQRSGFNNNRRFTGNNNNSNSRSYSNFGNRSYGSNDQYGSNGSNGFADNNKGSQNYYSGSNTFSGDNGFKQGSGWTGNTNYKSAVSPECQICSRRGHTTPNCYYRVDNGSATPRGSIFCQICGKKGHTALQCYHRNNYSYQGNPPPQTLTQSPMGMSAQTSNTLQEAPSVHGFSNADSWVVDTGATHHMTANLDHINHVSPYNGEAKITIGNGAGLSVKNIGASKLITDTHTFLLNNVLHVPLITMNLLSVKKLCRDNGCWFICDDLVFFIQDKATRVILYQGKSDDGELFKIPFSVFRSSFAAKLENCAVFLGKKVRISVWHRRLGHPYEEVVSTMLKTA